MAGLLLPRLLFQLHPAFDYLLQASLGVCQLVQRRRHCFRRTRVEIRCGYGLLQPGHLTFQSLDFPRQLLQFELELVAEFYRLLLSWAGSRRLGLFRCGSFNTFVLLVWPATGSLGRKNPALPAPVTVATNVLPRPPGSIQENRVGHHVIKEFTVMTDHNEDRKSTRLNSSHVRISYAVFCLKKKRKT